VISDLNLLIDLQFVAKIVQLKRKKICSYKKKKVVRITEMNNLKEKIMHKVEIK
jgi:hypothetical protein